MYCEQNNASMIKARPESERRYENFVCSQYHKESRSPTDNYNFLISNLIHRLQVKREGKRKENVEVTNNSIDQARPMQQP